MKINPLLPLIFIASLHGAPFQNGSFELEIVNGEEVFESGAIKIRGWTVQANGASINLVRGNAGFGGPDPADGQQQIAFNAGSAIAGSRLIQIFDTTPEIVYDVSFWVAKRGTDGSASAGLEARISDEPSKRLLAGLTAFQIFNSYILATFTFQAASAQTRIELTDVSVGRLSHHDLLLDDVRIAPSAGKLSRVSADTFAMTSTTNRSYRLQLSSNIAGPWNSIGISIPGAGYSMLLALPNEPALQTRFYRIYQEWSSDLPGETNFVRMPFPVTVPL